MWAHSVNSAGRRHLLVDHLVGTGDLAERFAAAFGAGELGQFLGRAHDVGKASCLWQEGLLAAEVTGGPVRVGGRSVDHKSMGVELAGRRRAGLLALALHGHHGGLTSPSVMSTAMKKQADASIRQRWVEAEAAVAPLLPGLFDGPSLPRHPAMVRPGDAEMLIRLLYSCLVDADALDTEAHHRAGVPRVAPAADLAMLWDRFTARRKAFLEGRPVSAVDQQRAEVYQACLTAATGKPGIYRLPAPTGSGKTIAAAAFGLRHALEHGLSRVIVAVPFTTITEQNAAVYRRLLDPHPAGDDPGVRPGPGADGWPRPVVLEHHSNVAVEDVGSGGGGGRRERWRRLAAENWDAPFVVTTTVQLFESLFGRRPAQMRKVHRLANAVVVLDEVQALPAGLLEPIVDGLRALTAHFGTTVLLASATQPELWELSPLQGTSPREIIPDPGPLYTALRRVRYRWWTDPKPTLAEVASEVAAGPSSGADQVLVIVNTIANARDMFELVRERAAPEMVVRHLSTGMCPAHRRQVLAEVRQRLADGLPVRLISTQLIEAGVDVDFPVVYRALAPADALQQAAGRANREGALGPEGGLVVVFDAEDGGAPSAYDLPVTITGEVMGSGKADPDDLLALRKYYLQYLNDRRVTGPASRGGAVQEGRRLLDYEAVADGPLVDVGQGGHRDPSKAFRMISDDTVPVVVRHEPVEADALIEAVRTSLQPDVGLLRRLQPHLVMLRRRTRDRADIAALCRPIVGDLAEWCGDYDPQTGIRLTPDSADFVL